MIVLAVKSYNGAPVDPVEASFDELGGTIGRADGNLMVLPDPERTISRVHAKVVFRGGRYAIEDRGSNPISVNGQVVGHGKEWPLAPGDVILIGGYELGVRASEAPVTQDDPFADVFGIGANGGAAGGAGAATSRSFPAPPAPPPPAARQAARPARAAATQPGGIPSDWNPLADEGGSGGAFGGALPAERDPGPLIGATAEPSIDDLFGLGDTPKKAADAWPEGDDFLGIFDPAGAASGGAGEPIVKARREDRGIDHNRSELGAAFPNAMAPAMPPPAPPPRVVTRPDNPAARGAAEPPRGAVVSWDGGTRETLVVAPPGAARRTAPRAAPVARAAAAPASAAPAAGSDELLRALLEGLGTVHTPQLAALTPDLMRLVGTMLAESVRGAVDLLQARASVKREVRADVTAIRPRENNPLKFSPNAALALQHLFGPPVPGFMRPGEAMRDAFRDLRAHELAVIAGMRSALAGLLQRFDPTQLESKITARSGLGALLAGGRKAQLWESYQALYSQLSAEAEDDFHEVFGKAFLQAYTEQLDRLAQSDAEGRA